MSEETTQSTESQTTDTGQQAPATPETQPGQQSEGIFTQADIDRIIGERLKRAEQTARVKILESMGIESEDEGKAFFEAERKRKEAEMSEVERANAKAEAYQKETAAAKARIQELEQQALDTKRDSALLQHLAKAHDPVTALTVLKAKHDVSTLMTDGELNVKEVEKMVNAFTANHDYLFKSGAPGSPSNNNGRAPEMGKEAREAARSASIKRLRRSV